MRALLVAFGLVLAGRAAADPARILDRAGPVRLDSVVETGDPWLRDASPAALAKYERQVRDAISTLGQALYCPVNAGFRARDRR